MSRRNKTRLPDQPLTPPSAPVPSVSNPNLSQALAVAEQAVERAAKQAESKQPRFTADPNKFFSSMVAWLQRAETTEPPYSSDSRTRDAWLQQFILYEPHIAGILSSVASIDSNRGWSVTGGRNQVRRITDSLHNFRVSNDISGWRPGVRAMSYQFHGTDLGAACEIGRDGQYGPLTGFFSVDSTRVRLTGRYDEPLEYFPPLGTVQRWVPEDYLRVTDLAFNQERFNGLGLCAVSRLLELAKIMVGMVMHDQEQLAARMPKGLLLLKGISQTQWEGAMATREAQLSEKERQYYGAIEVLASGMEDIGANLVALSNLPSGFDQKTFTDLYMSAAALCFGYDAREFWPMSGGALGTATETEVQHKKATQKGAGDFSLAHQEQIQRPDILPDTIQFEYQERDIEGQQAEVQLNLLLVEFVNALYTSGLQQGQPLLSSDPAIARERALQLLADKNVIPQEWTLAEEDVTATDTEDSQLRMGSNRERAKRDSLLSQPRIMRACESFPREAIVRYQWPRNQFLVLAESGAHLLTRRTYPARNRQADQVADSLTRAEAALNRVSDALTKSQAQPVYQPQASLSLTLPESLTVRALSAEPSVVYVQPTPVSVDVQPAQNNITVQPAAVTVQPAAIENVIRVAPTPVTVAPAQNNITIQPTPINYPVKKSETLRLIHNDLGELDKVESEATYEAQKGA